MKLFLRHFRILLFTIFSLYNFGNLKAQDKVIDNQELAWNNCSITKKIKNKFSLRGELSIRRSDFYKNWQQFLTRGMIYYHLKPQLKIGIGSSYITTYPYGKQPILTKRKDLNFFEQAILKNKVEKLTLVHNVRIEYFFREQFTTNNKGEISKSGTKNFSKLRYQLTLKYPIKVLENKDQFYVKVFDEIHFSTISNFANPYFQQNRYYIGLGFKSHQHFNLTVGYKNQHIYKSDNIRVENNRILDMGVNYTL